MAYTQTDIDKLKKAIARGALEVQQGNERVRFDSLDKMRERVRLMEAEVNGSTRTSGFRTLTPRTGRGL
ncbi:phage head-tail joining protein [Marinibacterium sp. SX1]|uniref:phage head-tail joining protein n=1 Tax=Marinibacterium sp. SX1 TaxID=3388424 RepID=UPI003D176A96